MQIRAEATRVGQRELLLTKRRKGVVQRPVLSAVANEAPARPAGPNARPALSSIHTIEYSPAGVLPEQPSLSAVPDWSKRIPALDGLRGVAILMVLLAHSVFANRFAAELDSKLGFPLLAVGRLSWSGVDLFFVLSGFLIGGILLDAKPSPRYFKTFYIRRAYRIFPLYFLVTGIVLLMYLPWHWLPGSLSNHFQVSIPWIAYLTLTQNWWSFGVPVLGATWSLCVEEQFYLTAPFLIRIFNRPQLVAALVSVVVASPLLRFFLYYHFPRGAILSFVLTPCRADALCLGVLSALFVRSTAGWRWLIARRVWLRIVFAVLLSGLVYMTYQGYSLLRAPMNTFGFSWMALFYTVVLLTVVSSRKGVLLDVLRNRGLMGLGTLAYCTYLVHGPLMHAGRRVLALAFNTSDGASWFLGGLLGIVATLVIASLSWRLFEKPLLRRGHKFAY
jgi:peptidoglycan/LPS O-acetylase OafA/YrhL